MKSKILVVDDEESIRSTFRGFFEHEGYDVSTACDYPGAVELLEHTAFDLILTDIMLGGKTGVDVLRAVREQQPRCPVVMITGYPDVDTAEEAVRHGAFDYLRKPVTFENLMKVAERAVRHKQQTDEQAGRTHYFSLIGKSPAIQRIYSFLEALADVQTTVLITGESGTGKELVAQALHYGGSRAGKPLVKVNCAGLTESLLESELFGHVKGAFTGAIRDKIGRFQRADGGTIFLDEIGDITPQMQMRLLRVLQEREFERVGDSTPVHVDVRVVVATNNNLPDKVRQGKFREDLYYRLKVVELSLPPLRERREDIPLLTEHFIRKFNARFNREIEDVSPDVMGMFMEYGWPGNVRELEHQLEHAFIHCRGQQITVADLPHDMTHCLHTPVHRGSGLTEERTAVLHALEKSFWNKTRAAGILGVSRRTIYRKIKEYDPKSAID
ncbi:MAG: sigma-54 dependent transcriptional regulator [Nitrospiraceae bacterium]|nr:sigma-54 dependent transcriptional regulator [Nitrospiraceae bacterium]